MRINKHLGIVIFMLLGVGFLQAKPVDPQKAEQVALSHLQSESRFKNKHAIRLQSARTRTAPGLRSASPNASYYVFNIDENQGFIIVSGDDVAFPVLAYSDKGTYEESNLPQNFSYWMSGLESEILAAQAQSLEADRETLLQWDNYLNGSILRSGVWPQFLIQTQWDQFDPYNLLCPAIASVPTVTGCVATAMAQIMKYHHYPERANSMGAYTTSTSINIPAIESPEAYDWNNMRLLYDGTNTTEEQDAVAALMYHCGVSSFMNYDVAANGGSGTTLSNAGKAFRTTFDYGANIQMKAREYYNASEWKSFLIKEIVAEQRPVLYAGVDTKNAGHAFVCDGYQSEGDYFHFNWGWGGYYDGWFLLNALNPGTGGAGSGSGVFSNDQQMLTHIQPATSASASLFELGLFSDLNTSKTTVVRDDAWTLLSLQIANFGLFAFNGSIGAFLTDLEDQIVDTLGFANITVNSQTAVMSSIPCVVRPSTKAGNYRLCIFSKISSATEWTKLSGIDGSIDFRNMTVVSYDPATTKWIGTTSDWNYGGNWSHGVPGVDSDVTIAATDTYPVLTGMSYVNDIYFEPETEIGRQDLLYYHQAHVQINFGAGGLARNQWHPMSVPLQQVYTGDFCFGGYPYTFLRQNEWTVADCQLPTISWKDVRSHSKPIHPGEGFVLWINSGLENTKGRSDLSLDGLCGLGFVDGIIELPYFENADQNASHRIHQYKNGKSLFYSFDIHDENLLLDTTATSVTRNATAYRLANNEVTVNVTFGEYDGRNIALVGNPFLSTIDLEEFYEDNADVIRPVFLIWHIRIGLSAKILIINTSSRCRRFLLKSKKRRATQQP